jgi:hypothetical protein
MYSGIVESYNRNKNTSHTKRIVQSGVELSYYPEHRLLKQKQKEDLSSSMYVNIPLDGKFWKTLRELGGVSQESAGKEIGRSGSFIGKLESGAGKISYAEEIRLITFYEYHLGAQKDYYEGVARDIRMIMASLGSRKNFLNYEQKK